MASSSNLKELAAQIAALRAKSGLAASNPGSKLAMANMAARERILFLGTSEDAEYVSKLKPYFKGIQCDIILKPMDSLTMLAMACQKVGIKKIVSTNVSILIKLVELEYGELPKSPSLADYVGSLFVFSGIEFVFISPLKQLFTVKEGKFVTERMVSKLTRPEVWAEATEFKWCRLQPKNVHEIYALYQNAWLIAMDIETKKWNLSIDCCGFTAFFLGASGAITSHTCVLELRDEWSILWLRKFCDLEADKIFQNGKYDNLYLLRFNCPVRNWFWDTAYLFHAWYAELPKNLGFLNAFFLRRVVYWKDLADTGDRENYLRYNAIDTWATGNVFIQMIKQAPDWAKRNYFLKFPLQYPSLLSELTGIQRDMDRLKEARAEALKKENEILGSLRRMIGSPNFNPSSHVHVKMLLRILGCSDLADSSNEKNLKKAEFRHPINQRILSKITEYRESKKARTTYLRTEEDADKKGEKGGKEYKGFILFSLNPHGTESGRNSSKESSFWCGLQIQNIPTGEQVKATLMAPKGFLLAEVDLEQAETRDTAYISGDENLIAAVNSPDDFHSTNMCAFFGMEYDSIYDREKKKTKNKPLRDISKRVNHGANYNMGPEVLIDTMGLKAVWETKRLLKLPFAQPHEITEYLLVRFHVTYPKLRGPTRIKSFPVQVYTRSPECNYKFFAPGTYYAYVAESVSLSNRIVSRAYHHTAYNETFYPDPKKYINEGDWTRYCFGDPVNNKLDLNSYVAHAPSSLNARTLDEAFMEVFYKIALPNPTTFRLIAQIHDSIFHAFAEGCEYHSTRVKEIMEIPVTVKDISGNYRTFTVPAAIKAGKDGKGAKFWSETE